MVYICTVTAVVSKPPHCLMRADAKTDMDIQQRKCPSALLSLFLAVNQENASDGNNLSLRVERIQQKEEKKCYCLYIFLVLAPTIFGHIRDWPARLRI